ncbi:hypothetical protein ABZ322_33510, partial [Streptomyces sp. NPDC006129]
VLAPMLRPILVVVTIQSVIWDFKVFTQIYVMRAGFTRALRSRPAPDVIVALTDGQTPWPSTRPPCRTVVGLFPRRHTSHSYDESDPEYAPDTPPPWARVVDIGS